MPNTAYPRPFWVPDTQNFAIAHEQDRHEEAVWAFGEYAMFILLWRIEDHTRGLVARCPTCYVSRGATAEAYGQADRNNCPDCFGTTFEGGYKAKIIRPTMFNEGQPDNKTAQRGEVKTQSAQVESTSDFRLRTHDFIFRGDGSRWHVADLRSDLLTTGFTHDTSQAVNNNLGFNYATVTKEDEASVAYLIPPPTASLVGILKGPPHYPADKSVYEDIRGPLFPEGEGVVVIEPSEPSAPPAPAFTPADIGGLVLWLAADGISGLADGARIGIWDDLSGGNHDALQAAEANKPTYKTDVLNGKPVVRFGDAGAQTFLKTGALAGATATPTIFIVGKLLDNTQSGFFFIAQANYNYLISPTNAGGVWRFYQAGTQLLGGAIDGAWHIFGGIANEANSKLMVDGVLSAGALSLQAPATPVTLGADAPGTGSRLVGDEAEVIVYNVPLSNEDVNRVGAYLAEKYALVWAAL